jgi:hypothetical protein
MTLLDKLSIAFGNPSLAKELIERFEKDDLVGLNEAELASALGNSDMARKIMQSSDIDVTELANCLSSPELAKELLDLRKPKEQPKEQPKKKKAKRKSKKQVEEKAMDLDVDKDGDIDQDDLNMLQKVSKKMHKILNKD